MAAFDLPPVAVQKAQALAAEHGVSLEHRIAGTDTWTWSETQYDALAAILVQFAAPARRMALFAGMWQTVTPGGLLLIQGYTPQPVQ